MIRCVLDGAVRIIFIVLGLRALFGIGASADGMRPDESHKDDRGSWLVRAAKRWLLVGAVMLAVAGFAGALVVVSGIVPIKASTGHWAITAWFLDFAKRRSVGTHTLLISAPPLDDQRLALQGAGQYHLACRPCHGSPGLEQPVIAAHMTPRPPDLSASIPEYEPEELFYIVKHGIKLTGMPAWPAQRRDDEVWAMVAFLQQLPQLDRTSYERLASGADAEENASVPIADLLGPQQVPPAVTETCSRCHGTDGLGRGVGAFPKLAGQRVEYLRASLEAYARGRRHSGVMQPAAAALDAEDMEEIARYYAARTTRSAPSLVDSDPAAIERGRAIALEGIADRLVPPCSDCHGPGGVRQNPQYPILAGQYVDYIALQLTLFKTGDRGGTEYEHIMRRVTTGLTDGQIRDVAKYYATRSAEFDSSRGR